MADLVEDLGLREVSTYTKKTYNTILKVKDSHRSQLNIVVEVGMDRDRITKGSKYAIPQIKVAM